VAHGMRWVGLDGARGGSRGGRAVGSRGGMPIVMGLDQHRAQITAEWIDAATGEVLRSRVAPAHRESGRKFLARFDGPELEVALEATTGWRFVVEELHRVGATVLWPSRRRPPSGGDARKRPKTDRADARLLRELVLVGRLPESWIAPDHILELRARVRLRHMLVDARGEWRQTIHAVLYHGAPAKPHMRPAALDQPFNNGGQALHAPGPGKAPHWESRCTIPRSRVRPALSQPSPPLAGGRVRKACGQANARFRCAKRSPASRLVSPAGRSSRGTRCPAASTTSVSPPPRRARRPGVRSLRLHRRGRTRHRGAS